MVGMTRPEGRQSSVRGAPMDKPEWPSRVYFVRSMGGAGPTSNIARFDFANMN